MLNTSRATGLLYLVFALSMTQATQDAGIWWLCVAAGVIFATFCGVVGYYQDKGGF